MFIGVSVGVADMTAALQRPATAADQRQRQIDVRVAVAVGDAAAVQDHRVIEQRAVAIRSGLHPVDQVRQLLARDAC